MSDQSTCLQRIAGKTKWLLCLGAFLFALAVWASPKDKQPPLVPNFVWKAQTVTVIVPADAPEPADEPRANEKARENVEDAILKWGRFRLVQEASEADLVIQVRKGSGKVASPTVSHPPLDSHGTIDATDDTIRVGAHSGGGQNGPMVHGVEVGGTEDSFEVLQSGDTSPAWKYRAKDALKAPAMVAVSKFRDAVEESEEAAKQKQQAPQTPAKKTP